VTSGQWLMAAQWLVASCQLLEKAKSGFFSATDHFPLATFLLSLASPPLSALWAR